MVDTKPFAVFEIQAVAKLLLNLKKSKILAPHEENHSYTPADEVYRKFEFIARNVLLYDKMVKIGIGNDMQNQMLSTKFYETFSEYKLDPYNQ